jgi:hypothetical protein
MLAALLGCAEIAVAGQCRYSGEDNGWVLALISQVIVDFDKSISI